MVVRRRFASPISLVAAVCIAANSTGARKIDTSSLWIEPPNIESRDLFYGPGGPDHAPRHMEFQFVKEDTDGTHPKYIVVDADGIKWKMKLGDEARSETASSRLVWATGYYTKEDYFLASAYLLSLPSQLRRGRNEVGPTGDVHHIRLTRIEPGKKVGIWQWKDSPFAGTREFNGLRVLMAVMNNWDLKDLNNAIVQRPDGTQIHMVSDLGASFGAGVLDSKAHLSGYRESSFIVSSSAQTVDFSVPGRAVFVESLLPPVYLRRTKLRWIGKDIPREHARWMGEILAQLSSTQLHDIFKASGFSPDECDGFAEVLEKRISALRAL